VRCVGGISEIAAANIAQGCIDWLQRLPGVKVNHKLVTTAGISMGGDIAAALATRYPVFRAGMVLHSPCAAATLLNHAAVLRGQ